VRHHFGACYVAPDGKGATPGRLELFATWLAEHPGEPIEAPRVYISSEKRNWVGFFNGQHRFAVLRDRGLSHPIIRVAAPRDQATRFRKFFSPDARDGK